MQLTFSYSQEYENVSWGGLVAWRGVIEYGNMNENYTSYQELIKPTWSPPAWAFGPVWTILYAIITVSFGKVFWAAAQKEIPAMVALPFVLNLIFNFSFTWIQFPSAGSGQAAFQNNLLASVDIFLVLGTLIWAMVAVYPYIRWVAIANAPYLLWVGFATVLQITITFLNQ